MVVVLDPSGLLGLRRCTCNIRSRQQIIQAAQIGQILVGSCGRNRHYTTHSSTHYTTYRQTTYRRRIAPHGLPQGNLSKTRATEKTRIISEFIVSERGPNCRSLENSAVLPDRRRVLDAARIPELIQAAWNPELRAGANVALIDFAVISDVADDARCP